VIEFPEETVLGLPEFHQRIFHTRIIEVDRHELERITVVDDIAIVGRPVPGRRGIEGVVECATVKAGVLFRGAFICRAVIHANVAIGETVAIEKDRHVWDRLRERVEGGLESVRVITTIIGHGIALRVSVIFECGAWDGPEDGGFEIGLVFDAEAVEDLAGAVTGFIFYVFL
jgi:hypothetical protein